MMSTVMVTVNTCNQKEKIQRHMSIVEAKASQQYSGKYQQTNIFLLLDFIFWLFYYSREFKFEQQQQP